MRGAIFLNGDVSRSTPRVALLSRQKPVHSFQGVDDSLGITVVRRIVFHWRGSEFFIDAMPEVPAA
jgi:hypothetical protein